MPKGPLIQDPAKREIVIAVVMGVLLILSLAGAALITKAKLGF